MSRWDSATVAVVGLSLAFHLAALNTNSSLPSDLGQYFVALPELYAGMSGQGELRPALEQVIQRPGAWWNMLIASWLLVLGRSPANWQLLDLLVYTALLVLGGNMGAKMGGARGRLASTLVLSSLPMVVLAARSSWIHVPEAVLLLAAINTWLADPTLSRNRSVWVLGAVGALALGLRPSALPWLGVLGGAMVLGVAGKRPRWTRLAMVAGLWTVGLVQLLPYISEYLAAKAEARDRYAMRVPDLGQQLLSTLGSPALVMGALGLLASLRRPDGPRLQAWAWVLLPILMVVVSKAGLDNFLPLALGIAWMAADLSTRTLGWMANQGWALVFALSASSQLIAAPPGESELAQLFVRLGVPSNAGIRSGGKHAMTSDEVLGLISATCPDPRRSCDIFVDQGLFAPFGESSGELPLFLASPTPVRIIELRSPVWPKDAAPSALVHWGCQGMEEQIWRERWPKTLYKLQSVAHDHNLRVAWERELGECMMIWLTPGGTVAMPDAMPRPGPVSPDRRVRLRLNLPAPEPTAPQERPRPRVPGQQRR